MKILCECGWHGEEEERLAAPNPFRADDTIHACPKCLAIDQAISACDEPGCWEEASCGTPTASGYRMTCGKHAPR